MATERSIVLENQVDQLSQEVLELYQAKSIYFTGSVRFFESDMTVEDVCRVLIKESARAVRARGAVVRLNEGTFGTRVESPSSRLTVPINTPSGKVGDITLFDKKRGFFFCIG